MIYTSTLGLFHLVVSCLALIAGTWVITRQKGTAIHKKVGYVYATSMVGVIVTSFMMYRLFGGFGVFHVAAIISAIALLGGMIPAITRKPKRTWFCLHFVFILLVGDGALCGFCGRGFCANSANAVFLDGWDWDRTCDDCCKYCFFSL